VTEREAGESRKQAAGKGRKQAAGKRGSRQEQEAGKRGSRQEQEAGKGRRHSTGRSRQQAAGKSKKQAWAAGSQQSRTGSAGEEMKASGVNGVVPCWRRFSLQLLGESVCGSFLSQGSAGTFLQGRSFAVLRMTFVDWAQDDCALESG
jgi:hypothetical protein